MKKIQSIPILLIVLLSVFSIVVFFSCTENRTRKVTYTLGTDAQDIARIANQENVESKESDAEFLSESAANNLMEIKLAQLAQQKSRNEDIIMLGNLMEAEHIKALQEVKTLAAGRHISIPANIDDRTQKQYDDLSGKTTDEFDREYTKLLVNGHKEVIMLFEKRIRETKDIDINNWIEKTLPALRKHLEHSEICEKKCA